MAKYVKLFTNHANYADFINSSDFIKPNVSYCKQEDEVHYNPLINTNGHAYVNLGLPSGTLWATMNVGANSETDYGLHFAWGETQGYADASTKAFNWDDYKYGNGETPFTKYDQDGLTNLELSDDAAHVNMGGEWHMPTKEQCDELFNTDYVTNEWVTDYQGSGVNGRLFTSVSNGNTMFIPAAGSCGLGEVYNVGTDSHVWSSSLDSQALGNAWEIYFNSNYTSSDASARIYGESVRGVIG